MRRVAATLVLALGLPAVAAAADCAPDRLDIRGAWGQARFKVELADDPDERARGLMFRKSLPPTHGMLFIYEHPQHARFWMKNTLVPLDMVFIDPAGRVTAVHEGAVPGDLTVIDGGTGVLAALEVLAGTVRRFGISVGDQVRHPAFAPETAAWPCLLDAAE